MRTTKGSLYYRNMEFSGVMAGKHLELAEFLEREMEVRL